MKRFWIWGILALVSTAGAASAQDLLRCETSINGTAQEFVYAPDVESLKESRSLRERLYGTRGKITCPGLVTLRVLTPELDDSERGPFCLQWDRQARSYIGFASGPRDAWMTCRDPSRSFCQRVNRSKRAALQMTAAAADFALQTGGALVQHPSGAVLLNGSGAAIGEQMSALGATTVSGAAIGALAVTAVAVGGAVYICSDNGAEGAALQPAELPQRVPGMAVGAEALGRDLPLDTVE